MESMFSIVRGLNLLGARRIEGNLIVSLHFYCNYSLQRASVLRFDGIVCVCACSARAQAQSCVEVTNIVCVWRLLSAFNG